MEDLDLCYRAAQAGWVTWYEPSVTVTHVKGGSAGRNRDAARELRVPLRDVSASIASTTPPRAGGRSNATVYAGIAAKLAVSSSRSTFNRRLLGRGLRARIS